MEIMVPSMYRSSTQAVSMLNSQDNSFFDVARVVLMHNHTRNTRIHLAEKNMDTISHAQGNMSALFYGHGNMSRNWNLFILALPDIPPIFYSHFQPVFLCRFVLLLTVPRGYSFE